METGETGEERGIISFQGIGIDPGGAITAAEEMCVRLRDNIGAILLRKNLKLKIINTGEGCSIFQSNSHYKF